jgi:hypothetical protein
MKVAFTSVYHLQTNDTVERANTLIFEAIKKSLKGKKNGKSAEVIPKAVWSHNTAVSTTMNLSPFRLLFRAEAVTPEEIKQKSARTIPEATFDPSKAEDKDMLESDRLKTIVNLQKYQTKMKV